MKEFFCESASILLLPLSLAITVEMVTTLHLYEKAILWGELEGWARTLRVAAVRSKCRYLCRPYNVYAASQAGDADSSA